jgi:hypothetical protein
MAIPLRQSTASQEIPLGCAVDSADGNTEESGLTIANTDIKLWKHGATTLANKNSGGATYISNGIYYTVLDATDTDTLGGLIAYVHVAGALALKQECIVYPANVYDSMIAGTDLFDVSLTQISGSAVSTTTAQLGVNAVQAGGTAWGSGAITSASLSAGAIDTIIDEQIGDSSITLRQAMKLMVAALAGKLSGAATATITIRNVSDTANVITATVDADGNRSAITLNL